MALREFTDRTGCRWRVWDIRPEDMPTATRAEDHLQSIMHGWLAFEPDGGGDKWRLSPIPANWDRATEEELERMLERADPVRGERAAPAESEPRTQDREKRPSASASPAPTIRTFRYPTGRYWTVNELVDTTTSAGHRPLLLFTSGARALETRDWPSEWARMSDAELAELLYRSFPRNPSTENSTGFRRRRGDA
jgi:hypothetical protein